jgi:hypothetical protein
MKNLLLAIVFIAVLAVPAYAIQGVCVSEDGIAKLSWQPNAPEDNVAYYRVWRAPKPNGTYLPVGQVFQVAPLPEGEKIPYNDQLPRRGNYWYQLTATAIVECWNSTLEIYEMEELESPFSETSHAAIWKKDPKQPKW